MMRQRTILEAQGDASLSQVNASTKAETDPKKASEGGGGGGSEPPDLHPFV